MATTSPPTPSETLPPTRRRARGRHFVIGVVGLVAAMVLVAVGVRPLLGGELVGMPYTYVTAAFDDVGTLKTKQQVRENSIVAGKVSDVRYQGHRALVTLRLDGDVPIYRNATATVLDESALAQKFVDLDRGTPDAGPMGEGIIDASRTADSSSLDDLLGVFDPTTRTALTSTTRELATGLGGRGPDLNAALRSAPGMLGDLERVAGALSVPAARLAPLLGSAHRLTGHFGGHDRELSALIRDTAATLRAVDVDRGRPLADTLNRLPPTLRQARAGLDRLDRPLADVESAITTVRPGAAALGSATPDVREVLRGAVAPLDEVPDVAERATPAVEDLTDATRDLRPLVPRLQQTLRDTRTLTGGLAPYARGIGGFFGQQDLLSGTLAPDKHYFSAELAFPGAYSASLPDPLLGKDFYPAPDRAGPTRPEGQHPDGGDR